MDGWMERGKRGTMMSWVFKARLYSRHDRGRREKDRKRDGSEKDRQKLLMRRAQDYMSSEDDGCHQRGSDGMAEA